MPFTIQSRSVPLALFLSFLVTPALAVSPDGVFSQDLDTPTYDCSFTVQPSPGAKPTASVHLALDWQDRRNLTRLTFTSSHALLELLSNGRTKKCGAVSIHLNPDAPTAVTVMRRGDTLALAVGDALVFKGTAPRPSGSQAGVTADPGLTVGATRIQKLEPVTFADDFMRTADEPGEWATQSGQWKLQSAWDDDPHGNANRFTVAVAAQNPFAWLGRSQNGVALCTTGYPFWEDYTFSAAVCPPEGGAAGIAFNLTDPKNGLLVRWSPANDRSSTGDRIGLYRLVNGKTTLIKEERGGYLPGQWYRLAVNSTWEGAQVSVDGQERLSADSLTPFRGSVGLYSEGSRGTIFDDVSVYGHHLSADESDTVEAKVGSKVQVDVGMQQWLRESLDWQDLAAAPGVHVYTGNLYGDQAISVKATPTAGTTGQLDLALGTDGKALGSGLRSTIQPGDKGSFTCALVRGATEIARQTIHLPMDSPATLRLEYADRRLALAVNGKVVIEAKDVDPSEGFRPMYAGQGVFSQLLAPQATSQNMVDTDFAQAAVDWYSEGTWMPTVRWACTPDWSFLGGWSRGDAVLWHKRTFSGDQEFEAFVGIKMEYPRERTMYHERYRDMGITICGDGHDPRSGYSALYGAAGLDGKPAERAVLYRSGVEVASTDCTVPGYGEAHRHWFHLQLSRHGSTVEFRADDNLLITYTDTNPLDSGSPGIWTNNNAITVARARIRFAGKSELRDEPTVILTQPDYPEWTNVGSPLTLDFSGSWCTTGRPVKMQAVTRELPAGTQPAIVCDGDKAVFTPKSVGQSWYELRAVEGDHVSQAFHLDTDTFDPAIGRDDSSAVVLYRFNEGSGTVVHDVSARTPAADLEISNPDVTHWVSGGRGLHLDGRTSCIVSKAPVDKLDTIISNKACSIELWISTDTVYPPTRGWRGSLIAWQTTGACPNFALGHEHVMLGVLVQRDINTSWTTYNYPGDPDLNLSEAFRTTLHHYVVTWDGSNTCFYMDGQLIGTKTAAWDPETWTKNAKLFLGNLEAGDQGYVGAYFLAAIHDRCLSPDQVLRNYRAGPDAKEKQ